ncbi:P-loop containing nucleoside triphosphate hydrolase protein [Mycena capillaripes]|nr:P-loop containing nucleoside triphosphate hydrolase protein [Mycena capillaripes]
MASCARDTSFGPGSTCREMDFTLYFEQTILSLSPDVIFAVFAVLRLVYLKFQPHHLKHSTLSCGILALKVVAAMLTVASTIASLVHSRHLPILSASLGLAAPIIQVSLFPQILLACLIPVEHLKSMTPSTLIITYAFLKGLFSAVIMRSSIKIGGSNTSTVLLALVMAAHLLVAFFELIGKRKALKDQALLSSLDSFTLAHSFSQGAPQISTSSFLSRALYLWLIPLMWFGRKKTLTIDDCGTIPLELSANASTAPLRDALVSMPRRGHYLVRASFKAFPGLFLGPILSRLLLLLATFAQPLLVPRMIAFISNPEQSSERGWALVGAFVCTYALIALMTSIYWEKVFGCTVRYRGALVGNIYSKTLRLSSASGREVGGGVASTYMSVDVERVCQGLEVAHELWAAVISIALAVALLYSQATWPAFLSLVITFLLLWIVGYVSRGVGAAHQLWLGSTDKRVKFLASIINSYLPMKLCNYEDVFAERSAYLRMKEMKGARAFYINISILGALSSTAWGACTLAVLGPYAGIASHHGPLDPERLFTIVTIVNLLDPPLTLLGNFIPQLRAAYASLKRIEKYLLLEERTSLPVPLGETDSANEYSGEKKDPRPTDITLEGATFSWAADKSAFLGPLFVDLTAGHLHLCVGPVASGKTLFLLSILGESVLTSGDFMASGKPVAYAAQDPLIVSGTIRENIVFGHKFSEQWYNTVLEACALTADIQRMSSGDGTYLGEKGATLSGGQRQRISLARAIYAKAPWTLLDDSFSSLDAETERHAQHLNSADRVLVFNAGAVQYQGTLDEVVACGYQFDRDMTVKASTEEEPQTSEKPDAATPLKAHFAQKETAETQIPQSSMGYTPYLFYMRMAGGFGSLVVIVSFPVPLHHQRLNSAGSFVYLQQWSSSGGKRIGVWVGGYSVLVVATLLFVYVPWLSFSLPSFTSALQRRLYVGIHPPELRGLLRTSPSYFARTPAGRIINRFSQDIFMCDLDFPHSTFDVSDVGLSKTPWLTLTVPFLGGFYWLMLSFYLASESRDSLIISNHLFQQLTAASKSPLYTQFSTALSGLVTIRALGVEKYFQDQNDGHLDRSQVPFYLRFASIAFLRTFLAIVAFVMATGLSVLTVGLRHSTNTSSLGLALASLTNMTAQLTMLLMNLTNLENASVAVSRIHEITMLPKETEPNELPAKQIMSSQKSDSSALGAVAFQNVRLQYGAELPPAVKDVSFQASPGQKIGICGRSGSGKSSLIMALFRAVDPSLMSGRVFVNGVDTQTLSLATLRESMSLVAQTPFIWYASLRQNLDPRGEFPDGEIWRTLQTVGMSSAISDLPDKLETVLDDGGSLSSGQRQLLCLARVLLRKTSILVLDEASSSLDADTDKKIRELIRTDLAESTVIAVAHRIETIVNFDTILVMEDGLLVESGSPQTLLSRPDSKFAQLGSTQGLRQRTD